MSDGYQEYINLWKLRSEVLESNLDDELRNKDLHQRLKSISYFNGIFEKLCNKNCPTNTYSGLIDYQRILQKLHK